ncbi:hypothetical protein IV203_003059 [Nitzschia inconspicua]|uniref:Uncharacterized protein n=1 Tax=Nitzschia inconspicua TaxID=303405 RepID=A0A9K3L177_9STRA|nr:hypothetical protein IV203_003059 [Nitzschia inconspicua]
MPPPAPPPRKAVRFSNPVAPAIGTGSFLEKTTIKSFSGAAKDNKKIVGVGKVANNPPPPPPPPRSLNQTNRKTGHAVPPPPPPPPPPRSAPPVVETVVAVISEKPAETTVAAEETNFRRTSYASPPPKGGNNNRMNELEIDGLPNGGLVYAAPLAVLSPLSSVSNTGNFHHSLERISADQDTTLDTINMLNFDFIEKCNSLPDLHRVIRLLSEPGRDSPQLLKTARERLVAVHKKNGVQQPPPPPRPVYHEAQAERPVATTEEVENDVPTVQDIPHHENEFGDGVVNISRITATNTTLDSFDPSKSTLNFSLSPTSTLHGINLVETPTLAESLFFGSNSGTNRLGPIPESPLAEAKRPSKQGIRETPPRYTSTAQSKVKESEPDATKLRQEATFKKVIEDFKSQIERATCENHLWKEKVDRVHTEHEITKRTLDLTRAAFCKKNEETRALEERLEKKIAELSHALASTADRSRLVISAEKMLRNQCEEELSKQNRKNVLLNKELRETRDDLEEVKRRHLQFRLDLMKAAGVSKARLRSLSQQEFVSYLSNKIKTMKEENDSLSRAAAQAKSVFQENKVLEGKIQETAEANKRLEAENAQLSEKIRDLRAEVKSSRAYIDKLLKTSNDTNENEWGEQEEQYKAVIQNLRRQLRQQESTVSIDLYKSAVEDSRRKLAQLRIVENNFEKLKEKVSELQRENEQISRTVKTPKNVTTSSKSKRSVIFSPTGHLEQEQNRLFGASQPPSAIRSPLDENYRSAKKTSITPIQPSKEEQKVGDMTGVTISFESASSPRTPAGLFKRRSLGRKIRDNVPAILREVHRNQTSAKESPEFSKAVRQEERKPENDDKPHGGSAYNVPQFQKENNPADAPRSASKEVRERFGGAKALQNKLKNMRSPRMLKPAAAMPLREVQVIFH